MWYEDELPPFEWDKYFELEHFGEMMIITEDFELNEAIEEDLTYLISIFMTTTGHKQAVNEGTANPQTPFLSVNIGLTTSVYGTIFKDRDTTLDVKVYINRVSAYLMHDNNSFCRHFFSFELSGDYVDGDSIDKKISWKLARELTLYAQYYHGSSFPVNH